MITTSAGELTESEKRVLIPLKQPVRLGFGLSESVRRLTQSSPKDQKYLIFGKSWETLSDQEKKTLRSKHPEVYKLKFADHYGFEPQLITF